jgi:hypothetical protein
MMVVPFDPAMPIVAAPAIMTAMIMAIFDMANLAAIMTVIIVTVAAIIGLGIGGGAGTKCSDGKAGRRENSADLHDILSLPGGSGNDRRYAGG